MPSLNVVDERTKCYLGAQLADNSSRACQPDFDDTICWPSTRSGSKLSIQCPFNFCGDCPLPRSERMASRVCDLDGQWMETNWSTCSTIFYNHSNCIATGCNMCFDPFKESLTKVTLVLCALSSIFLIASLCIFIFMKSLQCKRLHIHKHLVVAFIMRYVVLITWICLNRPPIRAFVECDESTGWKQINEWLCKTLLWCIMYFYSATVFWMLNEGIYLSSRLTSLSMKITQTKLWPFWVIGWGLPAFFTTLWGIAMEFYGESKFCWIPFRKSSLKWIACVPMVGALAINLVLLMIIVTVLIKKLRAENANESRKFLRTIRATLVLVPLMGIGALMYFYEPLGGQAYVVYLWFHVIYQYSTGIVLSLFYCFFNGEVRDALKRWWFRQVHSNELARRMSEAYATMNSLRVRNPEKSNSFAGLAAAVNGAQKVSKRAKNSNANISTIKQQSLDVPGPMNNEITPLMQQSESHTTFLPNEQGGSSSGNIMKTLL